MSVNARPIVIVTGANSGVGFGICKRFLYQLCFNKPLDQYPQPFTPDTPEISNFIPTTYDGITLIMACRSIKRAEEARAKLYRWLDSYIQKLQQKPDYDGHAHKFRENVDIQIQYLDLAVMASVFRFANEASQKYPYISHLICNAGLASFSGIHYPTVIKQVLTGPLHAVTYPAFYLQHRGELSVDGLGWVWQCNMFGHYSLFRALQPLLEASPSGSRVIWSSSLEATPKFYDSEDWQLKNTDHSYESSKYQIDLIATHLDRLALQSNVPESKRTRHFVSQPGICSTNVSKALAGPMLDLVKVALFYIARWCGSPHHVIDPFKSAIPTVHLALAPLLFFVFLSNKPADAHQPSEHGDIPVRYGAEVNTSGEERVGLTPVVKWKEHKAEAESLLKKCDLLFNTFREAEMTSADVETASKRI